MGTTIRARFSHDVLEPLDDARPRSILEPESCSRLPSPRGLNGLMVGVRPPRELARGLFGPGARLAGWTGTTCRPIKADAHDGIARDIPPRRPFDARLC